MSKQIPEIKFKRLFPEKDKDIPLPQYMTSQAAGMDIFAAVDEPLCLEPGEISLVPTGFAMALPVGYEAQIRPRSGLAAKYGIGIVNAPGTIDSDFRGHIQVALINFSHHAFYIQRCDRIAQMVIQKVEQLHLRVVEDLASTDRSSEGFGSTGT